MVNDKITDYLSGYKEGLEESRESLDEGIIDKFKKAIILIATTGVLTTPVQAQTLSKSDGFLVCHDMKKQTMAYAFRHAISREEAFTILVDQANGQMNNKYAHITPTDLYDFCQQYGVTIF